MKGKDLWDSEVGDLVQHFICNYVCILTPGMWAPLAYCVLLLPPYA